MNKKEEFKEFVRMNPILIKHVKSGDMSWQKYYEIYDLYGASEDAWKDFIKKEEPIIEEKPKTETMDLISWFKSLDMDSIQSGVGSLQRVVGLLSELTTKDPVPKVDEYKPRPLYKHFED